MNLKCRQSEVDGNELKKIRIDYRIRRAREKGKRVRERERERERGKVIEIRNISLKFSVTFLLSSTFFRDEFLSFTSEASAASFTK